MKDLFVHDVSLSSECGILFLHTNQGHHFLSDSFIFLGAVWYTKN
uniref:Uncharacterized protein n=1 Tax=Anguilla anguilla TaxID=7936 RepID=A0A0E9XYH0_ANGAN